MIRIIKIKDHPHGEIMAVLDIGESQRYILTHYSCGTVGFFCDFWRRNAENLKLEFQIDKEVIYAI